MWHVSTIIIVQVVGIDPDLERLQLARKKYPAANIQYLEGRAEDADSIPGRDYDVVFSNYVLQCIKDKERVFHNVNKCLKVGGKFGFVSFLYANYFEGRSVFTPPEAFSPEFLECRREDMTPFTVEEYRRIASAHHFDIVIMKEDVREWEFKDIEELIEVHMTHAQGRFDRTHFNTSLLQQHFEGRKISFELPHVTVVLRKLQ